MSVRVYVEGGGSQQRTKTACRRAFRLFFEKVLGDRPKPRITACGGRVETYRDFCRSLKDRETFPLLLVDSEGPVAAGKTACEHLLDRDHWINVMPDKQVHLMVQCMEAWFLADAPALAQYYGNGFKGGALSGNLDIEAVPKREVLDKLNNATNGTTKGPYHKTRHAFEILECIDPAGIQQRSRHADKLFKVLLEKLT